jgi:LEM3-like protein
MSTIPSPQFYVYVLVRPNGKPFYVGKGKGKRVFCHEQEARNGHRCHKCNVIRKIWRQGGEIQRYIVFTTNNEADALAYEAELIALYGRENLTNLTDGGEGVSGFDPSPEWRRQQSARTRDFWGRPEYRAKRNATIEARRNSPERQARLAEKAAEQREQSRVRRDAWQKRNAVQMMRRWKDRTYRERIRTSRAKGQTDQHAHMKRRYRPRPVLLEHQIKARPRFGVTATRQSLAEDAQTKGAWSCYRLVDCPVCDNWWSLTPACQYQGVWFIACPVCGVVPWRAVFRSG